MYHKLPRRNRKGQFVKSGAKKSRKGGRRAVASKGRRASAGRVTCRQIAQILGVGASEVKRVARKVGRYSHCYVFRGHVLGCTAATALKKARAMA